MSDNYAVINGKRVELTKEQKEDKWGKNIMKNLLVVVDAQNDFIDGALGTPEAQKAVKTIADGLEEIF